MRLLGAVCATILASSLSTSLIACNGADKEEVSTAKATSAASVSIEIQDQNGNKVGDASGVLIAPRLVLTAGHAISGNFKWSVKSADGKTKVLGTRGMTYDWMKYDSLKAHPRRHDVGVIHLDAPIKLDAYPHLVGDKPGTNLDATRIRNTGAKFDPISVQLTKTKSSPNNLLGDMKGGETLDTGGAVYNDKGIIGVVSGRGMTTGKVYVARVDQLNAWLSDKIGCAGGTTATYAEAATDKSKGLCDENGNPIHPDGSPRDPNDPNAPGAPGSSSSSSSSSSDTGGSCEGNTNGVCSGNCGGINPSVPGGSPNGGNDGANGNSNGSNPNGGQNGSTEGTSGSSGTNPSNPSGGPNGNDGSANGSGGLPGASNSGSANGSDDGSSGSNPNKGSANPGGSNPNQGGESASASSSSSNNGTNGGTGASKDEGEACQGPSDNPETCPPEADGCSGSACGGGQPDENIDYGNCGCSGASDGSDIDVR